MGVLKVKVDGVWVEIGTAQAFATNRNLLDNGQFAVKQRSATSIALSGSPQWLSDRWAFYNNGIGVINMGFTGIGAAVLPAGRPRPGNQQYLSVATAEAAGAIAAGDFCQLGQGIEGVFLQHLNWGTADAKPLTVSFDIYSSVAATYVAELYRQEPAVRSVSALVSVPVGWSTKTVTFPGDTVTPITNDNSSRLLLALAFGAGSNFTSGTLQTSWGTTANANRWPGLSNNLFATINNQVVVTNIQLEVGSQATPYEVRRYDDELTNCMRYFQRLSSNNWLGTMYSTTAGYMQTVLPVVMRAAPAVVVAAGPYTNWVNNLFVANLTPTAFVGSASDTAFAAVQFTGTAAGIAYSMCRGGWPAGSVDLSAEI